MNLVFQQAKFFQLPPNCPLTCFFRMNSCNFHHCCKLWSLVDNGRPRQFVAMFPSQLCFWAVENTSLHTFNTSIGPSCQMPTAASCALCVGSTEVMHRFASRRIIPNNISRSPKQFSPIMMDGWFGIVHLLLASWIAIKHLHYSMAKSYVPLAFVPFYCQQAQRRNNNN